MLFRSNELELIVRQHDLIARLARYEFAVLLRFDSNIREACLALINRVENVEKRKFSYSWSISDGTKSLEEMLKEIENPQRLVPAHKS